MQKVIYLLLCVFTLHVSITSTSAATLADSIHILPDVDSIYVCPGGNVTLSVDGGTDFSWAPAADFDDPSAQTVVLTPSASQWYYVTATVNDTVCTDSIYVTIPSAMPTFAIQVSTTDTVCPLDIVSVMFLASESIMDISWNTTEGVEDPGSTVGTDISPRETTEYIVTVVAGGCTLSDTFTIDVVNFRFWLISPDTIYLCLGDSGTIRHDIFPPGLNITWSLLDSTIVLLSPGLATVKPTVSTMYSASTMFEECMLSTTTFVKVDSLPDTALTVIPLMDPYCAGEMIAIFAERADTLKYPDIVFEWFPMDGQIQDSTNTGNVVVTLQDTTEFFRIMTNNACIDTSSTIVNVIPPDVPLSVMDTTLCPGDMFLVEILDLDVMDIEWTPEQGLSCTDCLNPTVTVQQNPITYMVQAKKDRCTVTGMLNVNIFDPLIINISSKMACPGDTISFPFEDSLLTNIVVTITGDGSLSCDDCPNPVVTYGSGLVTLNVNADELSDMHCGATGSATISMWPDDDVMFILGSDPPFGQGEVVSITLVTEPMPPAGTLYSWSVNNIPVAGTTATTNAPLNEVSNTIHVEWTNSSGCLQTADTIIATVEPTVRIPKAFTPDREVNTHFKVDIMGNFEIVEMLVFNRWGQVVYEGTSEQGWDGRRNGEQAPPEVYAYLIKLRNPSGDIIIEKGDVTLVR